MKIKIHVDCEPSSQLGLSHFHFLPIPTPKSINILNIPITNCSENHTEWAHTTLFHGKKNHNPIAFTQLFGLHQQHCQGDVAHELGETRSRRKAKQTHEHPAGTGGSGECGLTKHSYTRMFHCHFRQDLVWS